MGFNSRQMKKDFLNMGPFIGIMVVFLITVNFIAGKICAARMIFGIPCPGCGLTRAFGLVFQGRIREAVSMHFFWIPISVMLVIFLFDRYFISNVGVSSKIMLILKACVIITISLSIVYYVYRMVIFFPDKSPMIYDPDNIINIISGMINR